MAKNPSIHQALSLPSGYRVHAAVDGYIENHHYRLRMMRTDTHGQIITWALSHSWGPWQETTGEEFTRLAKQILHL